MKKGKKSTIVVNRKTQRFLSPPQPTHRLNFFLLVCICLYIGFYEAAHDGLHNITQSRFYKTDIFIKYFIIGSCPL